MATLGVDDAMQRIRRAHTLHKRGVTTETEFEADVGEVLLDLASDQFMAGRDAMRLSIIRTLEGRH